MQIAYTIACGRSTTMEVIGTISQSISLRTIFIVLCLEVLPCLGFTSFVFGDSLVDAGNNDYIFTLSKADSPPYGIDFKASGGRPTGRFTNGRTISDIIGKINYMQPYSMFDN